MVLTKRPDGSNGENHAAIGGNARAEVLSVAGCGVSREPPGMQNCWSGQHVSEDSKDQDREVTLWGCEGCCKDSGFTLSEMERNGVLHRS